ncbi:MAG: biotin/lipoyl-containing protein, partial [Pseudomonadota bacterium]
TPAPGAPGAAALEIGPADPARPLRFAEGAEIRRIVAHAARRGGSTLELTLDGARETAEIAAAGAERHVALAAGAEADLQLRLVAIDPLDARAAGDEGDGGGLAAPMSGKVARVMVAEGAAVAAGAPLLVIEAMKMEHVVAAPAAGAARLFVGEGDQVEEGQPLAAIDAADAAPGDAG